MGRPGEDGQGAGGVVEVQGGGGETEGIDVSDGGGVGEVGAEQGTEAKGVGEIRGGGEGAVGQIEGGPGVGRADDVGATEQGASVGGVECQGTEEVCVGAGRVLAQEEEAAGDEQADVVGMVGEGRRGTRRIGLAAPAESGEGLGAGGQHGRVVDEPAWGPRRGRLEDAVEVTEGERRVVHFEGDEGAVDAGLGELGVDLQGPVVAVSGRLRAGRPERERGRD